MVPPMRTRPRSSIVFAILDLLFALFYIGLFTWFVPSRSFGFTLLVWILGGLFAAGGVGLLLGSSAGRKLAAAASIVVLVACFTFILLLVSSAAYLHGIYDGIGQAGAAIGLLAAALAIELIGLLPALQLAHLWRLRQTVRQQARAES